MAFCCEPNGTLFEPIFGRFKEDFRIEGSYIALTLSNLEFKNHFYVDKASGRT